MTRSVIVQMDVITATDTTINTHNTASPIGLPHPIESAAPPRQATPCAATLVLMPRYVTVCNV